MNNRHPWQLKESILEADLEVNGTIVGSGNTVIDGKFKSYLVPTPFATSEKCLTFGTANCAIMVVVIPTENFDI